MSTLLPPLDLFVEVTDGSGVRYRWDSADRYAGNRPQNLTFSTKRGEGFSEASCTLARRVDRDYVDLHLFDDVAFIGAGGSVAYEGRVAAQPRSVQAAHSISVQCAGWMAHARDRPFTEVFVDRDLSSWQPPSRGRQATLMAGNFGIHDVSAGRDSTGAAPALLLSIQGAWVSPYMPVAEALYDAGPGNLIAAYYFITEGGPGVSGNATFNLTIAGGSTDSTTDVTSSDFWAGSNSTVNQSLTPRRYVSAIFQYPATPAGAAGGTFQMALKNLALYGAHGIQALGDIQPFGLAASDVIKYIAGKYCPRLRTDGVQDTTWPIPHLVFRDQTDPYDAFLAVNAYHLFELGVWENKTLTFAPSNRLDYDWEVRLSDFGVEVEFQGDSTEDLANGMVVEYTNVASGAKDTLTPDTVSDLTDSNPDNPVNAHGLNRWEKISLSTPTTADAAAQIGRAALAEFNQPKAPGTITIIGHVRDRAGHWQPGWKVRSGDTISITDHPNDAPRLITETSWNHDSKQLSVTVDSTAKRLDAVIDRLGLAITAAGLG